MMTALSWLFLILDEPAGEVLRDTKLNPLGWLFLIVSLVFVWGLTGWCFYKVLTIRDEHFVEPPETLGG